MPPQSEVMNLLRRGTLSSRLPMPDEGSQNSTEPSQPSQSTHTLQGVLLSTHPLTRELSDLSGSYANGAAGTGGVPGVIFPEPSPGSSPWRQAYVASKLPPPSTKRPPSLCNAAGRIESVDVIDDIFEDASLDLSRSKEHNRIPVTVLLMDGSKHTYELLQIWIDRSVDSVRDVVLAMQRGLPNKWKLGYDGIFQVRGNRFTQLIHILRMAKYDIQPNEILIAKPWAMTAKLTIAFATSVIRHLTHIQVINPFEEDMMGSFTFRPKSEDSPLLLSREAQKRIYSPDGILTHHHATQFLTFSPPFDSKFQTKFHGGEDAFSTTNISSISGSFFQVNLVDDLIANLRARNAEAAAAAAALAEEEQEQPLSTDPVDISTPSSPAESESSVVVHSPASRFPCDPVDLYAGRTRRNNVSYMMSQLNCCKTRDRVAALACCPPPEASSHFRELDSVLKNDKGKTFNRPLLVVQEEDLCGFDVRLIDDRRGASSRKSSSPQHQAYPSKVHTPKLSSLRSKSATATRGTPRHHLMEI